MSSNEFRVKGLHLTEHTISVPLDYSKTSGPKITVYAREIRKTSDWNTEEDSKKDYDTDSPKSPKSKKDDKKNKYLVYLQGGPGGRAGRPTESGGWIEAALDAGYRVILLDQRGTGRSTGASIGFLKRACEKDGVQSTANYMANFRADNIVRDCEELRKYFKVDKWSIIGQSYGGFCSIQYLSMFPESLNEIMMTGGIPPLVEEKNAADEVYTRLFKRVKLQNSKYYQRFPQDVEKIRKICSHLVDQEEKDSPRGSGGVPLPKGGVLTAKGFQAVGILFGLANGFETIHYLVEDAWDIDQETSQKELSHDFLCGVENIIGQDQSPIYLILHESIYCGEGGVSDWAAHRMRNKVENHAVFDAKMTLQNKGQPILFTGEMMFPWMLEELSLFRQNPKIQEVGQLLSKRTWGKLYDTSVLKNSDRVGHVKIAACSYVEDMFVDFDLSRATAKLIGSEAGKAGGSGAGHDVFADCKTEQLQHFMTSAYNHSGLREDGATLFKRMQSMINDEIPIR